MYKYMQLKDKTGTPTGEWGLFGENEDRPLPGAGVLVLTKAGKEKVEMIGEVKFAGVKDGKKIVIATINRQEKQEVAPAPPPDTQLPPFELLQRRVNAYQKGIAPTDGPAIKQLYGEIKAVYLEAGMPDIDLPKTLKEAVLDCETMLAEISNPADDDMPF